MPILGQGEKNKSTGTVDKAACAGTILPNLRLARWYFVRRDAMISDCAWKEEVLKSRGLFVFGALQSKFSVCHSREALCSTDCEHPKSISGFLEVPVQSEVQSQKGRRRKRTDCRHSLSH